jgi:hypothetical protein
MTTAPAARKRRLSPILVSAAFLSLASLAWTTWSLIDLLGAGIIGATVAAGADIIWGSVIIAEARGLRVAGKKWAVPAFGWATLLVVASFLCLHGYDRHSLAMAVAGPFLPFGAKAVWVLAIADMRDPSALTHEEQATIAGMERRILFEEKQHESEMRRRKMGAELQMLEVSADFDIEMMRQDKARELGRRRPLQLTPGDAPHDAPHRTDAHHSTDAHHAPMRRTPVHVEPARTGTADEATDHPHDAPHPPTPCPPPQTAPRDAAVILAGHTPVAAAPRPTATPNPTPAPLAEAPRINGLSKAGAVRTIRDALPEATASQIAQHMRQQGITADAAYVRTVVSRDKAAARRATVPGTGQYL